RQLLYGAVHSVQGVIEIRLHRAGRLVSGAAKTIRGAGRNLRTPALAIAARGVDAVRSGLFHGALESSRDVVVDLDHALRDDVLFPGHLSPPRSIASHRLPLSSFST